MNQMQNSQEMPEVLVQKLEGKVKVEHRRYVADKEMSTPERKRYKMEDDIKMEDAGYLLTFPRKGHSIRVSEEELNRLRARAVDPNGFVDSEKVEVDMSAINRGAGGGALVNVYQLTAEGSK